MNSQIQELYSVVRDVHEYTIVTLNRIRADLGNFQLGELADLVYAVREAAKFLEDIEKDFGKITEHASRLACQRAFVEQIMEPIRTDYCTATPDAKTYFDAPSAAKNPQAYNALCDYLQIDTQLRDDGTKNEDNESNKVIDMYWPGLQAYARALVNAGYAPPPGMSAQESFTKFKLRIVKRKGVLESKSNEQPPF